MHHGIHFIKIHFAVILYVLGNACYILIVLIILFSKIILQDKLICIFFKNNVSSFSFSLKFLNTLRNIDIEINVLLLFF